MKFLAFGAVLVIAAAWVAVTLIGLAFQVAVWVTIGVLAVSAVTWVANKLKGSPKSTRLEGPADFTSLPR